MKIPKYKPTTWNIKYCLSCKRTVAGYCYHDHEIIERPNVPFLIKEMRIKSVGKWTTMEANGELFRLSMSNLKKLILGCGVERNGFVRNQWWMYTSVGGRLSIKWIESKE